MPEFGAKAETYEQRK